MELPRSIGSKEGEMNHDQLKAELSEEIQDLRGHMDSKFAVVERVLGGFGKRVADVEASAVLRTKQLAAHDVSIAEHGYRISQLESIKTSLDSIKSDMHAGFETLAKLFRP